MASATPPPRTPSPWWGSSFEVACGRCRSYGRRTPKPSSEAPPTAPWTRFLEVQSGVPRPHLPQAPAASTPGEDQFYCRHESLDGGGQNYCRNRARNSCRLTRGPAFLGASPVRAGACGSEPLDAAGTAALQQLYDDEVDWSLALSRGAHWSVNGGWDRPLEGGSSDSVQAAVGVLEAAARRLLPRE